MAILWQVLITTLIVQHAGTKERARIPVWTRPESTDCNCLTTDQHAQLPTPTYKNKKEKREAKKMDVTSKPTKDTQFRK